MTRRRFVLSLVLAGIVASMLFVGVPRIAQAGFNVTLGDIPRRIEQFINRNKDAIKAKLKVAGDVAYKTSLRIFYQQLAQMTFDFVSTAGTGQKPLFLTNPNYFQNVFVSAQNDFLDDLSTHYFGSAVANPGTADQRLLGLFARGILNPATASEVQCQKDYEFRQKDITGLDSALKIAQKDLNEANRDPNATGVCPVVESCIIQPQPQNAPACDFDPVNPIPVANLSSCVNALSSLLASKKQEASRSLSACIRAAAAGKQTTLRDNPQLNQIVGNEQAALVISEMFRPEQNDIGSLLKILSDAQTKGLAVTAAERDIIGNSSVLPVRTLSGEVKAPGSIAQNYTDQGIDKATNDADVLTGSRIADVISKAAGDALVARIGRALLKNCGLNPAACKKPTGTSPQSISLFGSAASSGGTAAASLTAPLTLGRADIIAGDPSRNPVSTVDDLQSLGIIDQRFAQAVDQRLTVGQAIEQGFLDGNRTFGFTKTGDEPSDGYSYRTILYLRQARIVPVGWELAAQYIKQFDPQDAGLDLLVSKYSICGQDAAHDDDPGGQKTCQASGGTAPIPPLGIACLSDSDCNTAAVPPGVTMTCAHAPTASPYCGLVDPDWVLKAPLTYCRKQGAGEEVVVKTFVCDTDTNGNNRVDCAPLSINPLGGDIGHYVIQRQTEVCVDEPTCVAENEDGSCRSYGYCFEERPTFRLGGTMCPNYYASCTAYTDTQGFTAGYLTRTIETNGCSSDNAGCLAYCGDRSAGGTWMCSSAGTAVTCPAGSTCTCRTNGGETCQVAGGQQACTTNSGVTCGLGTNVTYFDRDIEPCDSSVESCRQFISLAPTTNLLANGNFEVHKSGVPGCAAETVTGWGCRQISSDTPEAGSNTTSVVIPSGGQLQYTNDRIPAGVDLGRPVAKSTLTMSFFGKTTGSCSSPYGLRSADGTYTDQTNANYTSSWQRFSKTFFVPDGIYDNTKLRHVIQPFVQATGCDVLVDNIQLEVGEATSTYADYGTTNNLSLNKNRLSCQSVDVGCDRFTPAEGGDPITAVVNWTDRCAAEDAGCRAYRKEAIDHLPFRAAVDPINLTATSGRSCSAADVGCEEYTNLDTLAQGGEGKEYYSRIQQCVKPADGSSQATYFTWVGDDRSGFQLKSFRLKVSNITLAGETGNGPCTNLKLATSVDDNNPACEDTTTNVGKCTPSPVAANPDCQQYFDGDGNVFLRLRSRTIPVSDECHPYRNTVDERTPVDHVYHILSSQSTVCPASAAQCRAFTGNAGNNTRVVFTDTFEGTSTVSSNWKAIGGSSSVALSPESVTAGGRSMDASGDIATQDAVLTGKLKLGKTYTLSFWAKPNGATRIASAFIQVGAAGTQFLLIRPPATLTFASEWQPYTIGPVTLDTDPGTQAIQLGLSLTNNAGSPAHVFMDNVVLNEITDSVYLIDGSYRTCPDSALGCSAYTNRLNQRDYFKSVSRLCAAESVGCIALFDTQNSSTPFISDPIRGVGVPADQTVSFIDATNARCTADAKGCTAFGQITYDVNKRISRFETVYLKDNPDNHLQILCSKNELMCQEFTTADGSRVYFKDPNPQTCEYKKLTGDTEFRWYITGTSYRCPITTPPAEGIPTGLACTKKCVGGGRDNLSCVTGSDCPASIGTCVTGRCVGGALNGNACASTSACATPAGTCVGNSLNVGHSCTTTTASADCTGGNICDAWVGLCPEEQNGCTEYRDPSDPQQCRSNCPLQLSPVSGKPIAFDDACQATFCVGGAKDGANCSTNADCPSRCSGGSTPDRYCQTNADCGGGGTCGTPGICNAEGFPGCRAYTYLKQTINLSNDCNGRVDVANGCRPFNDTSNSVLNFRSQ